MPKNILGDMETEERKIDRQKFSTARDFFTSTRGQYIVGQALHIAIEALESVEGAHKEVSNISDMKFIKEELFPMYSALQTESQWKAKLIYKGLEELEESKASFDKEWTE